MMEIYIICLLQIFSFFSRFRRFEMKIFFRKPTMVADNIFNFSWLAALQIFFHFYGPEVTTNLLLFFHFSAIISYQKTNTVLETGWSKWTIINFIAFKYLISPT